jgi:hypothetical protein
MTPDEYDQAEDYELRSDTGIPAIETQLIKCGYMIKEAARIRDISLPLVQNRLILPSSGEVNSFAFQWNWLTKYA